MQKEKVVLFLDYANINRAVRENGYRLDYYDLLQYVGEERFLVEAYCYVPIDPRNEHRRDREIEELWRSGYIVITKLGTIAGGSYKCNFDVEITMDVLKAVYQVKPDIIVLASGDSDFIPLIQEVRKSGIRVEIAAFAETAGPDILLKGSGFIDLDVYYQNYLAAQNGEQNEATIEEQFKDLIQSQNDEQPAEDNIAAQDQDELPQPQKLEDEVKTAIDQAIDEAHMTPAELIQNLDL